MSEPVLKTTVVGSYVQPDWLVDREMLKAIVPPRVRAHDIWRIPADHLEEAQDAATLAAIRDMERAGIDVITDGEIRRESYSNRFATALEGVDIDHPAEVPGRSGRPILVPRVTGPIRRSTPIEIRDVEFLRANTNQEIKITLPGPFTMTQTAVDEFYGNDEACAMAYAEAVNEEVLELFAAGANVVQIDEPWMQAKPQEAKRYAVKVINRALEGAAGTTAVHMCFGYAHAVKDKPNGYSFLPELANCNADQISIEAAQPGLDPAALGALKGKKIVVGVLDLSDETVETPEIVAERIRAAMAYVPAEQLLVAPDCGMKYLSRDVAFGKLKAMAGGAAIIRDELLG
ncbi:MAG: 5-methyltetrahydropteroyltriglutamate--homocysteine methyltransferase [Rhodospirillaceae bacterium]|nr:5-methyltetrahydropteroyltriglutamate--homocysteine methyltransferase [Rhodospirillaceae bacterium]|tara:strand:+ start:6590 stop:7624 length:1035 start_codon:yes stop_codon:yes gene_type:complete